MDLAGLQTLANSLGAGASFLLVLALVGVVRGWWVPGYQYRDLKREVAEWKHLALRSTDIATHAVEVAKQ